jgi:tetratricopeptide (TPR) repeat protein
MLAELSRVRRDTTSRTIATNAAAAGAPASVSVSSAAIGQTGSSAQAPAGSSATAAWSLTPAASGTSATSGTAAGRPSRAGLWVKVAVGAAVVATAAYYFVGPGTPAAPAFAERDTVLIADFVNTTGEAVFDDALKQAVAVQLQQTPYVTLLPDQAVQRTLRLMQRDDDTAVTGAVARELCQRAGARASVEGSIAPLGRAYVLTLGVYNCATGASIAQQQAQAGAKEDVLDKVGEVVTALRQGLGESLASIEKYDVPVTEATTASLDALKSYGLGLKTRVTRGDDTAIPFFLQAVDADPEFALAWAKLSVLYSNRGRTAEARDAATKAFELRGRVSEYERMYIDWSYATRVLQDDTKTREILEFMTTAYPRDFTARNNFGVYYMARSDYERAIAQFQVAIEVAPGEPLPHANMAYALFNLGRFDDAVASAERAQAIRPDGGLATTLWMTAVVRRDARAEEFRQSAEKLATPAQMQNARASVAAWGGRLDEFAGLVRALKDGVEPGPNAAEQQAGLELFEAANLVLLDGPSHLGALRQLQSASMPPRIRAQAVAIETALGDPARVAGALRELEALGRTDPAVSGPTAMARAYSLARQGQFDEALARAQALVREQSQERDLLLHVGRIRELQGDLDGAIRDYQSVTEQVSTAGINLFAPLARIWLADALIRQGRAAEARPHLDALLAQWKDADREFALLKRARDLRAKAGA